VSAFPSTANSTRGNRQQRHRVGEIEKVLQGEPKVGIKGKECHILHIVTESVETLIIAIYQFVKSFIEKMRPGHVTIS
jgi:hypothetical protein